jgi:hypothetical protein
MPIDYTVNPVQIENPMNQLAKVMQLREMRDAGDARRMQMGDAQAARERKNKLYEVLGAMPQGASNDDRINVLRNNGFLDEADKVEAGALNRRKVESEATSKDIDNEVNAMRVYRDLAGMATDPQTAIEYMKVMHSDPRLKNTPIQKVPLEIAIQQVGQDPVSFENWKKQFSLGATKFIEMNKPTQTILNNGGTNQVIQTPGLGGAPQTMMTSRITESENNIANNRRIAQEGAANRAVQMRGQNMTDARAKEASTDGYSTKPLPTAALKMQNDAIDVIGTAGGINKMLSGVEQQITDKKVKFGPVSNLMNQGLNAAGMSTEESRNFASFKSNLEKIRNESLRLNSGVQTDGDAQRAWNELFQNITDTELVKQRLAEIKSLNNRAVDLQKLKVDSIRGNYKVEPYDYSKLDGAGGGQDKPAPNIDALLKKYL